MLRWMLVFDQRDSDTIWILKTAPRRMYPAVAGGLQGFITVSDAPTRFGEVSYTVDAIGDSNVTEVSFQWKNPDFPFKNPDFPFKNPDFLIEKC